MPAKELRIRSKWWYVLPILFSIIGGIISFFAIRYDDPEKARNCLIVGIILFIISTIIPIILITSFGYWEIIDNLERDMTIGVWNDISI